MKRIKVLLGSLISALSFVPALAFAQQNLQLGTQGISGLLTSISNILAMVVPVLIALAVIVFLFGVLKFIFNAGDAEKRKDGKWIMIWGLVGIVVMVSIWGIVGFAQSAFDIGGGQVTLPLVPHA